MRHWTQRKLNFINQHTRQNNEKIKMITKNHLNQRLLLEYTTCWKFLTDDSNRGLLLVFNWSSWKYGWLCCNQRSYWLPNSAGRSRLTTVAPQWCSVLSNTWKGHNLYAQALLFLPIPTPLGATVTVHSGAIFSMLPSIAFPCIVCRPHKHARTYKAPLLSTATHYQCEPPSPSPLPSLWLAHCCVHPLNVAKNPSIA